MISEPVSFVEIFVWSEPYLLNISAGPSSRTSSQMDLASPDSLYFSASPTPIITGEDNGDGEIRGKELASKCWNEDEDFLHKEKIAEWLGGQ